MKPEKPNDLSEPTTGLGNETPEMNFNLEDVIQLITNSCSLKRFSKSIYDLKKKRFICHQSAYTQWLARPSICTAIEDNSTMLNANTLEENIAFCNETNRLYLKMLYSLTPEQQLKFKVIYTRQLLEKTGVYRTYIHNIYPIVHDKNGELCFLYIETERIPKELLPAFRRFVSYPNKYVEHHRYSALLHNLKLTDKENDILKLYVNDSTQATIARKLNNSPHTVKTHYKNISDKMELDSISQAKYIARFIELY